MTNVSVMKLNVALSLHLFSLALVALGLKPQQAISAWPLCSLLNGTAYSLTIMWLRCRLAYSLLQSSVMCIRGAHSHIGHCMSTTQPPLDLVSREALLPAQ